MSKKVTKKIIVSISSKELPEASRKSSRI